MSYARGAKALLALFQATHTSGHKTSSLGTLLQLILFLVFLLCAVVYILLSPFHHFQNDSNISQFKERYEDNVVFFDKPEQIGKFPLPCLTNYITCDYGKRVNPITGQGSEFHTGIDFGTMWHSPLLAIADGEVVKTGADKNFGKYALIRHRAEGETFYTFYAHMSSNYVMKGQEISVLQVIGKEGGDPERDPYPGRTTGHHLHFEIRTGPFAWQHTDPYEYILKPPDPPPEPPASEGTGTEGGDLDKTKE